MKSDLTWKGGMVVGPELPVAGAILSRWKLFHRNFPNPHDPGKSDTHKRRHKKKDDFRRQCVYFFIL